MNENLPRFEISIPNSKPDPKDDETSYALLNQAHEDDQPEEDQKVEDDISGENEEEMHSTEKAYEDNIQSYKNELAHANTFGLLEKLLARLKPDPNSKVEKVQEKSEFDIRTGENSEEKRELKKGIEEKQIELQNAETAYYMGKIRGILDIYEGINEIKELVNRANTAKENDKIRPEQFDEIEKVAEEAHKKNQDAKTAYYVEKIRGIFDIYEGINEIKEWVDYANTAKEYGKIRPEQFDEIEKVAEEARKKNQDAKTTYYMREIRGVFDIYQGINEIKEWVDYANTAKEYGKIRPEQFDEIEKVAEEARKKNQDAKTAYYVKKIRGILDTYKDIDKIEGKIKEWMDYVNTAKEYGKIRPEQFDEIEKVAEEAHEKISAV